MKNNGTCIIGYTREYRLLVVPVRTGGEYIFSEAREASEADVARCGFVRLEDAKLMTTAKAC